MVAGCASLPELPRVSRHDPPTARAAHRHHARTARYLGCDVRVCPQLVYQPPHFGAPAPAEPGEPLQRADGSIEIELLIADHGPDTKRSHVAAVQVRTRASCERGVRVEVCSHPAMTVPSPALDVGPSRSWWDSSRAS
eukprot:3108045-Prymnesium_polylepis.1